MKTSHIEILAPAGSWESLRAAVNAGCNSVYLGIADFNMRATAARNFKTQELPEIVKYCHEHDVRVYVTVNTLLYNDELDKMRKVVDAVCESKADAVIAADMATIQYLQGKNIETHISTQLSISNTESLKFYSQFADRFVLARELDLKQIKEIVNDIKKLKIKGPKGELVKVEVFAHGAMCTAVSGRCGMSVFCTGLSANRGKCSQACRRKYKIIDTETEQELVVDNNYVMSAADLCTIGMLLELVETGVHALKIEGRGRPPEYVDTVVKVYKEALGAIESDIYSDKKAKQWRKELKAVFNRGQSTGLYMGKKFTEWAGVRGSKATREKFKIGVVEKYFPKIKVAQVKILAKDTIRNGEEFYITGENTGFVKGVLKNIVKHVGLKQKKLGKRIGAKQGDIVTFKVPKRVRRNDTFYIVRGRR
ncbi:peptidase U32 family protein [Patescibacteria group bacterium]